MGSLLSSAPKGSASGNPASQLMNAFPLVVLFAIFYFLILRPQQTQEKTRRKMVDNLKVGDRVLTQGGLYGSVTALKGETVMVKIAETVKVEFAKAAITQVFPDGVTHQPLPAGESHS